MTNANLVSAFPLEVAEEMFATLNPVQLIGLSGSITTRIADKLPPIMLCSKNGEQVKGRPFSDLNPPTQLEEDLDIFDHFSIDLTGCEP